MPGSAFKPFVYQVALDMGYSGATTLVDIARTYTHKENGKEEKWQPKNYGRDYKGLISLRESLVLSRNLSTINLVNDIGLTQLLKQLDKYGIENLPRDLSVALGTVSLSPLELAKYFSSFANEGTQVDPYLVRYIEKDAEVIYKSRIKKKKITSPEQAYLMTSIMQDVVSRGTGTRARVRTLELAGKTGTTNDNVDAWFAGYSPTMETIVWFGNDDNSAMHPRETGGNLAGPAFSMYHAKALEMYPQQKRKFDVPENIMSVEIQGRKEYFTNISRPPRVEQIEESDQELLF